MAQEIENAILSGEENSYCLTVKFKKKKKKIPYKQSTAVSAFAFRAQAGVGTRSFKCGFCSETRFSTTNFQPRTRALFKVLF